MLAIARALVEALGYANADRRFGGLEGEPRWQTGVSQSHMGRKGLAKGANFLLTQGGRVRLGSMVDPKYTLGASILKRYLPPYP
jgi:hypothetical protein